MDQTQIESDPQPEIKTAAKPVNLSDLTAGTLIAGQFAVLQQQLSGVSRDRRIQAYCYRVCLTGYRMLWVDLLDEMLQKEPHGYSVLWKRILGVAGARLTVERPEYIDEDDSDYEKSEAIRK